MLSFLSSELRLILYIAGLYATFMYWGYLQEKITTSTYISSYDSTRQFEWNYPLVLNLCMASSGSLVAYTVERLSKLPPQKISTQLFALGALSSAIASPIGYSSLKYITYPLMILTKSSKPVPVMVIGLFFYKRTYPWFKYTSVLLLVIGISFFSFAAKNKKSNTNSTLDSNEYPLLKLGFGILLVLVNLCLDGLTNNEQDHVFHNHQATSLEMMKNTNYWQVIYQCLFLLSTWILYQSNSELTHAFVAMGNCPELIRDIIVFCGCAACGQILIFGVIKEFGSLVWITVSITRQLFTILMSVFLFKHQLKAMQWLGIIFVFGGLLLEIVMTQLSNSLPAERESFIEPITPRSHRILDMEENTRPESPRRVNLNGHFVTTSASKKTKKVE